MDRSAIAFSCAVWRSRRVVLDLDLVRDRHTDLRPDPTGTAFAARLSSSSGPATRVVAKLDSRSPRTQPLDEILCASAVALYKTKKVPHAREVGTWVVSGCAYRVADHRFTASPSRAGHARSTARHWDGRKPTNTWIDAMPSLRRWPVAHVALACFRPCHSPSSCGAQG